jgi:hypothetical protein
MGHFWMALRKYRNPIHCLQKFSALIRVEKKGSGGLGRVTANCATEYKKSPNPQGVRVIVAAVCSAIPEPNFTSYNYNYN